MAIARPSASHSVSLRFLSAVVSRVAESSQSKQRCWFCTASLALGACLGLSSIIGCARHHVDDASQTHQPKVSPTEIVIGSSAALSGQSSFLGLQTVHGSLARIEAVNASGGVYGRKIKLISLDDGYEPARAVTNTQELLVDDNVFALFDYVGTPTSTKIIDLTNRARVPTLGFFTGAEALRTPFRPFMFHVRDSYYAEAEAAVALFADQLKFTRIAVLYQEDAFGQAVLAGLERAMKKRNLSAIAIDTYTRGSLDVERARDTIVKSGAEAVAMVGSYAPLAKYVKISHEAGHRPWFHTVSFVGSEAFARELIEKQHIDPTQYSHIVVTQVVPSPFADTFPAVREYRALAAKYFPGEPPNYVALEGFLSATVLVRALEGAGPNPTRESFVAALEKTHDLDLGIGHRLTYSPTKHTGLVGTYYSNLHDDGKFQLFDAAEARR